MHKSGKKSYPSTPGHKMPDGKMMKGPMPPKKGGKKK